MCVPMYACTHVCVCVGGGEGVSTIGHIHLSIGEYSTIQYFLLDAIQIASNKKPQWSANLDNQHQRRDEYMGMCVFAN